MKRIALLMAGMALIMLGGTTSATAASSDAARTVKIVGRNTFIRNSLIQSTLRFTPQRMSVPSGSSITWTVATKVREPHSVSVVRRGALPDNVNEVFSCRVCQRLAGQHFGGDRPDRRLNAGAAGFDRPGDSRLLLRPGASTTVNITAPAGTTLHYLCMIHPWMQGKIVVR